MDIERTIEIAAPADAVWAVLTDVERWPDWTASIRTVHKLEDGPLAPGSRVRIHQPRLPAAVWTVSVVDPGRFFEWRNESAGLTSVAGHRVEPAADGSSIATLSIDWSGWLAPLIRVAYGGLSRRYVDMEAEGLRGRCES